VDAASAFYVMGQAFRLPHGQRFLTSGSLAHSLALPAANGPAAVEQTGSVVCVIGDGSLMTQLHQLASMKKCKLDLKLCVINIDGYLPVRNTQRDFRKCHYVGVDPASGVYMPPIDALVGSFGMPCMRCVAHHDMEPIVS
jgi:acetolactate synthase-1/2/3 large subunit